MTCRATYDARGYTKNMVLPKSARAAVAAICVLGSSKLFKTFPSVSRWNARYPQTPQVVARKAQKVNAAPVTFPHRSFVGESRDPAMIKQESWQTNAKDSTPRPIKIVSGCITECDSTCPIPPADAVDSLTGLKNAIMPTINVSNTALIADVLERFAISLCIASGKLMVILVTTRIALLTGSLSMSTPNSSGMVSLIIIK
mmetsp:Transcript_30921/g.62738  ORF Transcript_30921/g.62738 Transcript_30921/m.62738 type:complete len:200 (+) Transcript_30921:7335-7934(+)